MDLRFTPEEEDFCAQVRSFLQRKLPAEMSQKVRSGRRLQREDMARWHAILNEQGWLAPHWPVEYGGPGWSPVQCFLFDNECALAHAPRVVPFGVNMLGPVLIRYGTEAQKRRWLPRILDGSDWWCQGYSEPGAGSDLAGLRTSAVRDGAHYVVNGQKAWTTLGQYANMIFCLVRTDREAKKQEGISFLLIDLATPGVELRPILTLDGEHEVNEVFFTDVRVPVENLVGEENRGWSCAKYLLTYERTNIAGVGFSIAALAQLKEAAGRHKRAGRPLLQDPQFAARLARVEIDLENMKTTNLRVLAAAARGGAPGAESSLLKIRGTQIRQEISSLLRRAMGTEARANVPQALEPGREAEWSGDPEAATSAARYFNQRKLSIFGGSNEIQKNIVAKQILGL
jgi:hypothetical protein